MVLARSSIRAFSLTTRSLARPSIGAASTTRPILQQLGNTGRRGYSDQTGGHEEKKSSDIPWYISLPCRPIHQPKLTISNRLLGSIGLGGPAAYYLIQTGPEAKPHHGHDHATSEGQVHHEENTEQGEEEAQSEPAASPEAKEPEESAAREVKKLESSNQKPSEVDQVSIPSFICPIYPCT